MILLMRVFHTKKRILRRKSRILTGGAGSLDKDNFITRSKFFREYEDSEADSKYESIQKEVKNDENRLAREQKNLKSSLGLSLSGIKYSYPNREIFESQDLDPEKTIITLVDCHGSIKNKNGKPENKLVPENIILCFLSPVGTFNYVNDFNAKTKSIMSEFLGYTILEPKLTPDQFKYIVKNRMKMNDFLEIHEQGEYNCFANSMWYYPGQIYPDINISLNKTDIQFSRLKKFPNQGIVRDIV